MAHLVELLEGDGLGIRLVKSQDKKKLKVVDGRGRQGTLSANKVVFTHSAASIDELRLRLQTLADEVDVPLLWESVNDNSDQLMEAAELAELYFDQQSPAHASAMFRALWGDKLHFRRRGQSFTPRSPTDLTQLREQREAEERVARELSALEQAMAQRQIDDQMAHRLQRYIRGGEDRLLGRLLESSNGDPRRAAFDVLLDAGRLTDIDSAEIMQANLQTAHPAAVVEHAERLEPALHAPAVPASFSIDDPDTREVDDVLSVCREGDLTRVNVDIADAAAVVLAGDPADREAQRRATTVYLPTNTYYMLPERIGCEVASLHQGRERPALRTSIWIDSAGRVERYQLERKVIKVGHRLDYTAADAMLASDEPGDEVARELRMLEQVANKLADRRRARGALFLSRREWKIRVSDGGAEIRAMAIPRDSPSRALVQELMILCNGLAARAAREREIPIIYRTQQPPVAPLPPIDEDNPAGIEAIKTFIKPASLSLHAAEHWALGLDAYTQVTSPLRRYADLVVQRQLCASLADEEPPTSADELLRVLATGEATEREVRRIESSELERWRLEYVARQERKGQEYMVLGPHPAGGYLAEASSCGARGLLMDDREGRYTAGQLLSLDVKSVRPRKGVLRLLVAQ